jgi:glycosyltransferase involved in cell wall biosynthesis
MQEEHRSSPHKLRVLISGALPPPMGGVGFYYQTLLSSSLPTYVDLRFVQTSSTNRELSKSGSFTMTNLVYAFEDWWRFTHAAYVHRPQITHIGTSYGFSFLKNTYCILIARLFRSRVILHPHCSLTILYLERPKWWQWFFKQVIKLTDGIVALSQEWLQLHEILPSCPVFHLPNAISLNDYRPLANRHFEKVDDQASCKVLYIGYLGNAKGSFDLLDAVDILRRQKVCFTVDMVGSELTVGEIGLLREKVKHLQLEAIVRICPPAYGADKLKYLEDCDIFVYPSHREGMPMAVLEAMASGLPIVASNVGGLPDLIQDGKNGFLVESNNPEQLASAIHKLIGGREMRKSMGMASYEIVCKQYDIDQHVTQLFSIYNQVVSASKASP